MRLMDVETKAGLDMKYLVEILTVGIIIIIKTKRTMPTHYERYVGTLLGGCIGDILGSTNEGKTFDTIRSKNSLVTKFHNNRYTDDTELTLVLARYLTKYQISSTSDHSMVQEVHSMYQKVVKNSKRGYSKKTRDLLSNWNHCMLANSSETNGAIMRIAPMALIKHKSDQELYDKIRYAVYCTHDNKDAIDTAFIHVKLLISIINQKQKTVESIYRYAKELAQRVKNPTIYAYLTMIHPDNKKRFEETQWNVNKSIFGYDMFQIKAIDCFICALICFLYNFKDPKAALIMAANLGGDTDTIAKLVGDLVGATYGTEWIPEEWQNPEGKDELTELAKILYNHN
jgi:ADP-ribosylglycohydrolase